MLRAKAAHLDAHRNNIRRYRGLDFWKNGTSCKHCNPTTRVGSRAALSTSGQTVQYPISGVPVGGEFSGS